MIVQWNFDYWNITLNISDPYLRPGIEMASETNTTTFNIS